MTQVHVKLESSEQVVSNLQRGDYFVFESEMFIRVGGRENEIIAVSLENGLMWDRHHENTLVRKLHDVTIKEGV